MDGRLQMRQLQGEGLAKKRLCLHAAAAAPCTVRMFLRLSFLATSASTPGSCISAASDTSLGLPEAGLRMEIGTACTQSTPTRARDATNDESTQQHRSCKPAPAPPIGILPIADAMPCPPSPPQPCGGKGGGARAPTFAANVMPSPLRLLLRCKSTA
eukprot:290756-Chlamydomonas_euryale.AAC.2